MEADGRATDRGFVLLGDQPYRGESDPLGYDGIVEDLANLILASRGSTPFTLGIEAPWGMGKSTLMTRLCDRIGQEDGVTPVLFNAWTADEKGALEGLVKTVLNQLDPNALRRALRSEKLIGGLRLGLGLAAGFFGLGNVVDTFWSRVAADPRARNDLRKLVEDAVAEWRDQQPGLAAGRLLCVFVDDLDRCSPRGVLEIFEAMKLYLDVPGIVFVIGYDEDIVSDLVLKEKGYSSDAISSRDYLEKFIQIVYRIPRAAKERSGALIEALLETSGTGDLFGATEREIVINGSEANPRRVKRFVNGFVLAYGLDPGWREFEPQSLVRVQLLQMYFRDFARLLERPSERDPIADFLDYVQARDEVRGHSSGEELSHMAGVLRGYGLAVPEGLTDPDHDLLLAKLEENVPAVFRSLARREDFVSLVRSLSEADDWQRLRTALAEGHLALAKGEGSRDEATVAALGMPSFAGLRLIWVGKRVEMDKVIVDQLERMGASIRLVPDVRTLEEELEFSSFDVIFYEVFRDAGAGFAAVERLRSGLPDLPPVIFVADRLTEAENERAEALGADVLDADNEWLWGSILASVLEKRSGSVD